MQQEMGERGRVKGERDRINFPLAFNLSANMLQNLLLQHVLQVIKGEMILLIDKN
jgi:hypothetical protein